MTRPRNHRLHNVELKARIAYWQERADVRRIQAAESLWWTNEWHRAAEDYSLWCQTVADELAVALRGGRGNQTTERKDA